MITAEMPMIQLSGAPRERGFYYGKTAQKLIAEVVESWRSDLGRYGKNGNKKYQAIDPVKYQASFYAQTDYLSAIEAWTPGLLEEIKGIAEGSGQSFEDILALHLIDEEWVFGLHWGLDKPISKCTAFGVTSSHEERSYAGQNMDVSSWVENKQVLLRVRAFNNAPEALLFSFAGGMGLNGLNANGLGVTCNTLSQLQHSTRGLPVAFFVRELLAKQNIDDAEHFLRTAPHASGQNYILSSRGDMRCFECSGNSVDRYSPEKYHGSVFHTNHPLVNPDESELLPPEKRLGKSTLARLDSISSRLGDPAKSLDLNACKVALSAHDDPLYPVSRNTNKEDSSIGFTAGCSIYELGEVPRLHLAAGPPCETDFVSFDFVR